MATAATAAIVGAKGDCVKAKTSVWWDIENCEVPKGWDANLIVQNVISALSKMNFRGPVSITAYGDTTLIPPTVQQALSSTGVGLHHVPAGVKDASDKKILVDMLLWAVDNPAPANYMLISGDRDFSNALHQLSMRTYTILLAQPPRASAPLVSAAKYVWLWTSLASGGPPIASVESTRLLSNGLGQVSNNEVAKRPVSEQAQSSKPTDFPSDGGDTKVRKTNETNAPRGLSREIRRYFLQNGSGAGDESATCRICNVFCGTFEKVMAHVSDPRHIAQVNLLQSRRAKASVSAKPAQEAAQLVEPLWCEVCQVSCITKDAYKSHTYGKRHRSNLELQSGKSKNVSEGPVEPPKDVLEKEKNRNKKASDSRSKANFGYVCRLCNAMCQSQYDFDSHLRGQRHTTMLSQAEALNNPKKLQEKGVGEKDRPSETIAEPQLQSQDAQKDAIEKHVATLKQTEAHNDSNKFQEIKVGEKDQQRETIAVPQLQPQEAQENAIEKQVANVSQSEVLFGSIKLQEKCIVEKDQPRETIAEPKPNAYYVCHLCNVKCQSQIVFDSHLRGKKHFTNVSQSEALIDSKKLQVKAVGEKDKPKETIAEPQVQSQKAQKNTNCFEKHVTIVSEALNDSKKLPETGFVEPLAEAQLQSQNGPANSKWTEKHVTNTMVSQSEALTGYRKLEKNCVQGKASPAELIAEPHSPSQYTRENSKFFKKQNQELSEMCGTSENSVKETFPCTKDRVETVPNGKILFGSLEHEFEVPKETRERFDGIVKPVNLSEEATGHLGKVEKQQVMTRRRLVAASKLCHLCVVICDSQGLLTVVCDNKYHWTNQKHTKAAILVSDDATQSSVSTKPIKEPEILQPVWCQVCQMSCNSKVAYENHTYGKKHRQKLELQSAKNENMSKGPATFSNDNAEKKNKVFSQTQTDCDSHLKRQSHAAMVKEQAEALVDPRRTEQECDQEKSRQTSELELIVESRKIREESDLGKITREEHVVGKMDDLVFKRAQEEPEEVKEINTSSEIREQCVFTGETKILKESRGFLDVIPERKELPPTVNVTEKLEDESNHKPQEPENKSEGSKKDPGEAPKKEEMKGQVDNFWTRLWGKKN